MKEENIYKSSKEPKLQKLDKNIILTYIIQNCKIAIIILIILPAVNAYCNGYFLTKYFGLIMSTLRANGPQSLVKYYVTIISIAIIVLQVIRYIQYLVLSNTLSKLNVFLKEKAMEHFLNGVLEPNMITMGEKVNKFSEQIIDTISMAFNLIYRPICSILMTTILSLHISSNVGIFLVVFSILFFLQFPFIIKMTLQPSKDLGKAQLNSQLFVEEISRNFMFEKIFRLHQYTLGLFKNNLKEEERTMKTKFNKLGLSSFIINMFTILSCIVGGFMAACGSLPPELAATTFLLMMRFFSDLNDVPNAVLPITVNLGAIRESMTIYNLQPDNKIINTLINEVEKVQLKNISYSYQGKIILSNLNYTFNKGIHVINGKSGCGKSTLIKIIIGLLQPEKGEVIYNDHINIENLNILNRVSYMSQNDGIYNRTVEENIRLSWENNDISTYVTQFQMSSLMANEAGLQGEKLSGGQIRRVGLLRLINFYQKGNIIILDEPFIGLDSGLINEIINYILSLENHVIIVVDHTHSIDANLVTYLDL